MITRPMRVLAGLLVPLLLCLADAKAQDLTEVLDQVAALWANNDAHGLARFAAKRGVSLDIDGRPMGPLGERQLAAVLRKLFDERETLQVRRMVSKIVGGNPTGGFGEINWIMRARGTTIPERTTVFVAFTLQDERWRITQIRFVQP